MSMHRRRWMHHGLQWAATCCAPWLAGFASAQDPAASGAAPSLQTCTVGIEGWTPPSGSSALQALQRTSAGTGLVLAPEGYIVTAAALAVGSTTLVVHTSDGRALSAHIAAGSAGTALALLRLAEPASPPLAAWDIGPAPAPGTGRPAPGRRVRVLGYERSGAGAAMLEREGQVLALPAPLAPTSPAAVIASSVQIERTMGGGPLVDSASGALLGFATFVWQPQAPLFPANAPRPERQLLATPVSVLHRMLAEMREHGRFREATLGLTAALLNPAAAAVLDVPAATGVLVAHVIPNGSADRAGVLRNDIIVLAGSRVMRRPADLIALVQDLAPGDKLELTLNRQGKPLTLVVTADELRR
jgi:S1-C subfamily serine protease